MFQPTIVGHVHLKVRDLARAVKFYTEVLGLRVVERAGHYAFLSFSHRHHDVALQEVGPDAPLPARRGVGLYHFALEVPTEAAWVAAHDRLVAADVPVSPVDHGISKALYFSDPDGNGIEIYVDTRASGHALWHGSSAYVDVDALRERVLPTTQ